jgi:adenosylcobinamide-phosphate synthase
VVLFGAVMTGLERRIHRDARGVGLVHAMAGVSLGLGAGALLRSTAVATSSAVAGRALVATAGEVGCSLQGEDVERARELLPSLVGRDPSGLGRDEIARAVVESVAENTVDAIVAPAFWGSVAGAPGALGFRSINTLDAMVGHRSPRYANYGWASARLDDALAWAPARLTAALVALVRPRRARAVWVAVREQAPAHPSPNAGVAEAAFAAALGVSLGGTNRYGDRVEERVALGTGRPVAVADIGAAIRLSNDVTAALAVVLALIGSARWWVAR